MTTLIQQQLESLIDQHGVYAVLDCMSGIAGRKAEHIHAEWQDHILAEEWEKAELVLDAAASKVLDLFPRRYTL